MSMGDGEHKCSACGGEFESASGLGVHQSKTDCEESPWRDSETLRELYLEKGQTQDEIAGRLGTTRKTIKRWLNKHGIPLRDRSEAIPSGADHHYSDGTDGTPNA